MLGSTMTGRVITIRPANGFAFILPDGCPQNKRHDHFAHIRDFSDGDFEALEVGAAVEFDSTCGPRGLRAENIRRIAKAAL